MKKFKINVNGNSYDVEVEEIRDGAAVQQTAAALASATPAPIEAAAATASEPAKTGSIIIEAPMPGTIVSIAVKAGDDVRKGDVLCILEAMKMENEIFAPESGKVASVNINAGQTVNPGDLLISLM